MKVRLGGKVSKTARSFSMSYRCLKVASELRFWFESYFTGCKNIIIIVTVIIVFFPKNYDFNVYVLVRVMLKVSAVDFLLLVNNNDLLLSILKYLYSVNLLKVTSETTLAEIAFKISTLYP